MNLDVWIETTLSKDRRGRVKAALVVIEAIYPVWNDFWEDEEAREVTAEAHRAVLAWLADETSSPSEEDVERCAEIAGSIGESLHTFEGTAGAGSAMLVPALLAAALHAAADGQDTSFAFDEVLPAIPDIIASAPELEAQIQKAIRG